MEMIGSVPACKSRVAYFLPRELSCCTCSSLAPCFVPALGHSCSWWPCASLCGWAVPGLAGAACGACAGARRGSRRRVLAGAWVPACGPLGGRSPEARDQHRFWLLCHVACPGGCNATNPSSPPSSCPSCCSFHPAASCSSALCCYPLCTTVQWPLLSPCCTIVQCPLLSPCCTAWLHGWRARANLGPVVCLQAPVGSRVCCTPAPVVFEVGSGLKPWLHALVALCCPVTCVPGARLPCVRC